MDESRGESFWQAVLQGVFYLGMARTAIQKKGLDAETLITLESLIWCTIVSTISLTWGQFKVRLFFFFLNEGAFLQAANLTVEYSTSVSQKCVLLFACLGLYL